MAEGPIQPLPAPDRSNWTRAQPEVIPEPTLWPPALALGVTLLVWGFITSWIMALAGLALFIVSLAGWIKEIRHERKATLR